MPKMDTRRGLFNSPIRCPKTALPLLGYFSTRISDVMTHIELALSGQLELPLDMQTSYSHRHRSPTDDF